MFTEVGPDFSAFPNAEAFASWLKLCPSLRSSGGKKIRGRAYLPVPRLATALKLGAQSLHDCNTYLGQFYSRMRARFGPAIANKATAHKTARIIFAMVTTKTPYDQSHFAQAEERAKTKKLARLYRDAAQFGMTLAPGVQTANLQHMSTALSSA